MSFFFLDYPKGTENRGQRSGSFSSSSEGSAIDSEGEENGSILQSKPYMQTNLSSRCDQSFDNWNKDYQMDGSSDAPASSYFEASVEHEGRNRGKKITEQSSKSKKMNQVHHQKNAGTTYGDRLSGSSSPGRNGNMTDAKGVRTVVAQVIWVNKKFINDNEGFSDKNAWHENKMAKMIMDEMRVGQDFPSNSRAWQMERKQFWGDYRNDARKALKEKRNNTVSEIKKAFIGKSKQGS